MNIHPNKIAAVLTKAHLIRSVSRSGGVFSYRNEGFTVTDLGDKLVVDYRRTSRPTSQTEIEEFEIRKNERIAEIADLLTNANYSITTIEDRVFVDAVVA